MVIQRAKCTLSGKILDVDIFPIYEGSEKSCARAPKNKESSEKQKKLNEKNSVKKCVRTLNANFEAMKDVALHLTYRTEDMPSDRETALKDFSTYFRRLKYYFGTLGKTFRYMYRVEVKRSKKTGIERYHLHGACTGLNTAEMNTIFEKGKKIREKWTKEHKGSFEVPTFRDFSEWMWGLGDYPRCEYLRENENGFEGLAKYMIKNGKDDGKRWIGSKTLVEPTELPPEDGAFTSSQVEKMAKDIEENKKLFEKKYPEYEFVGLTECEYNEYNGYWYLSARLRRRE